MIQKNYIWFFLFVVTANAEYHFNTKWFTVPLDHNNFREKQSFNIKYLENDDHWDRSGGPIFFYTGSKGKIEDLANNTGFIWETAPLFRAKVVFAEHRYYGASRPPSDVPMGYLSVTQALADFANLLHSMDGGTKYPVIAFGGSYGGMLSAYFRMKFPHIVAGAIASSAPINMFNEEMPCDTLYKRVTSIFALANVNCSINIRNSWNVIRKFTKNENNYDWLTTNWRLCEPMKSKRDVYTVQQFLKKIYFLLATVNYPYPSDSMRPLPAHPVRTVCKYLSEQLSGQPLLEAISKVLDVYTNNDKKKCVRHNSSPYSDDDRTTMAKNMWRYQTCTEMPQIICTTGVEDMFTPIPFSQTVHSQICRNAHNVNPNYKWAMVEFGGHRLQAASNIVFSNGLLDPWAGYGILENVSETVPVVVMNDAAHQLDLMASNAADPPSVRAARHFHKYNIRQWITNFQGF